MLVCDGPIYASQSPALDAYAPFTSGDADIYGTRTLAETLAKRNGWECHFTNDPNSAAVAILVKPASANEPALTIEVLNEVNGLTESDLNMSTVIELADGARYRTPSPLVLFKAKLSALAAKRPGACGAWSSPCFCWQESTRDRRAASALFVSWIAQPGKPLTFFAQSRASSMSLSILR